MFQPNRWHQSISGRRPERKSARYTTRRPRLDATAGVFWRNEIDKKLIKIDLKTGALIWRFVMDRLMWWLSPVPFVWFLLSGSFSKRGLLQQHANVGSRGRFSTSTSTRQHVFSHFSGGQIFLSWGWGHWPRGATNPGTAPSVKSCYFVMTIVFYWFTSPVRPRHLA